ncbi:mesp1 [Pungitius sinensis]
MDTCSAALLNYSLQYQWLSDSDLSSISSSETLSPGLSMDSSLSPSSYQQLHQSTPKGAQTGYSHTLKCSPCSRSGRGRKSGRGSRMRSKQRESASEKEKLRMRDLTKALHHLRSYLPPSVAPAGQTLTKIDTLRLTISYISYLSAQLGLSEEALFQRREQGDTSTSEASSPDILSYLQHGAVGGQEAQLQDQSLNQSLNQSPYQAQCHSQGTVLHSGSCGFGADRYDMQYFESPMGDTSLEGILQSSPETQSCCQMGGKDFCMPLVPREYWG